MNHNRRIYHILVIGLIVIPFLLNPHLADGIPLTSAEEGFFLEVLLNKEDIHYDLDPLRDLEDEGLVNRVEVDEMPFSWGSNEYFVFRAHSYDELAVMVYETDNSILAEMTGEDVDLKGLSITLTVPTKVETVQYNQSKIEIPIPENTEVEDNVVPFMESMGYSGGPIGISTNGGSSTNLIYIFSKDNISISIYLDDPDPHISIDNNWTVQILGRNVTIGGEIEIEGKALLEFIGINSSVWDEVTIEYSFENLDMVIPDIKLNIADMNWEEALRVELEFLRNMSVINGLTDRDIQEISSIPEEGIEGLNDIILYHDAGWSSIRDIIQRSMLNLWSTPMIGTVQVPTKVITFDSSERNRRSFNSLIFFSSGFALTGIVIGGSVFFFSRLKKRSLKDNANRSRIIDKIGREPGIHYRKLSRSLELKQGVLSYHLNILEKHLLIKSVQDGNNRKFYLYNQKIVPNVTLSELQESIIMLIYNQPGISQSAISRELGRSKALVNYHLKILRDSGLVIIEKDRGATMCYVNKFNLQPHPDN